MVCADMCYVCAVSNLAAPIGTCDASVRSRPAGQRFCLGLALGAGGEIASAITAFTCRLACAVALARKLPATRFAALSHLLMNGFFFSQGLAISLLRCFQLHGDQISKCIPSNPLKERSSSRTRAMARPERGF